MTTHDPFRGYDQWKTASPYDEDCAADFELNDTIAEKNTLCPACGYNDNTSVAQWTVDVEKAAFPNDLLHDEITFAGWHCEQCDWMQEAIDSDYDRLREYKKSFQPRIDTVNRAIANYRRKPAITIDELFSCAWDDLPEGNFKWEETEAGDWHVYRCGERDCPSQWHKISLYCNLGRKDDKRFVEIGTCDEDGNWDMSDKWKEGEYWQSIGEDLANRMGDYFIGWAEYWLDCAESKLDPLRESTLSNWYGNVNHTVDWTEFCLTAAEDCAKHIRSNP